MMITLEGLLERFKVVSKIKTDITNAFIGFFVVSRCFQLKMIDEKEENLKDRHKMLINHAEIQELLNYIKFDLLIDSIEEERVAEIYKFMDEFLAMQGKYSQYTLGNLLNDIISIELQNKNVDENFINKIKDYQFQQGFFSINETEALLLLLSEEQKIIINNIIESHVNTYIDKIYIISYNNSIFSEEDYVKMIENNHFHTKNHLAEQIIFYSSPKKNFNHLQEIISNIEEKSFLIVIGIDKLATINKNKATCTTHFHNSKINLYPPSSINWANFTEGIDGLFSECNLKNIYMTAVYLKDDIYGSVEVEEITSNSSDLDSFNIISAINRTDENIHKLLNLLMKADYEHFYEELNKDKFKIGEDNYNLLLAYSALNREDYLSADNYFLKLSDNVRPENMLILANICINKANYLKALEILTNLYNKDRYLNNLMQAILETTSKLDDDILFEEWLSKAFEVNDKDCTVIQYAANYYLKKSMYEKAAFEWKRLYDLTDNIEYRLLSDINFILFDIKSYKVEHIERIIGEYSKLYPEIKNEVNLQLGLIFSEHKKKYAKSLEYFLKIDTDINNSYAYQAALERLRLYKDKILKINISHSVISDEKLMLFANELIKDVSILTYKDKSNYNWSNYIENTLPYEKWKELLFEIVLNKIYEWSKIDDNLFEQTNFNLEQDFDINSRIREIDNTQVIDPQTTVEEELLIYLGHAIGCMCNGELQESNDTVFTLFRLADIYEDSLYKNMALIFGLLGWGNSNYKIGDEVESIIALISAIDLGIQIKEIHFPFMIGFKILIDFLYNNSKDLKMDDNRKAALFKLYNNPYNQLSKSKYFATIKDYNSVIENKKEYFKYCEKVWSKSPSIQVLFNDIKEDDLETMVDELKVLVNAYYNKRLINKACQYLCNLKDTIVVNLYSRVDNRYKLFYEWAEILLKNNNYILSKEFLLLAIKDIEKLRSVNHKRERSFVGKEANKIYRKYIEITCKEKISEGNNSTINLNSNVKLKDILTRTVPRAIIEQKLFNNDNLVSDELNELHNKYYDLFLIINNMKRKGINDDNSRKILKEFFDLKKYLEENHPSFKPLPIYDSFKGSIPSDNYKIIKNNLNEDELFYQMVLVDNYLVHNFITKNNSDLVIESIDLQQYKNAFEALGNDIVKSDHELSQSSCVQNFKNICDDISSIFIKPLYTYIEQDQYKKLYFMPDLNLTYFSMNYMRYKNSWLIDIFDSIENVIDFNAIGNKTSFNYKEKYLANFINNRDKNIAKIYNMVKSKDYVEIIDADEASIVIDEAIKFFVFVGHGISSVSGFDYLGAKYINKSRKEKINLKEYLNIGNRVENILIISCSSGTLINDYAERNDGVWSSLLEKNVAYILYCKWDVSTEYSKQLLEKILETVKNSNKPLSKALAKAQREMSSHHPILWAGLEVWKNE